MKALLIDYGNHYKQCVHVNRLYSEYNTTILTHVSHADKYKNDINGCEFKILSCNVRMYNLFSLILLFILSWRYERIVFVTGFEYVHGLQKRIISIFWYVYCRIFGKKVNLYIKNSERYKLGWFKSSLRYVRGLYFESDLLRSNFVDSCDFFISGKCYTSYVYYYSKQPENSSIVLSKALVRVGLVGSLDETRRDYSVIANNSFENIEFILAGKDTPSRNLITSSLKNKIIVQKQSYSSEELDFLMSGCDILLCLNKSTLSYGINKGTGAFADAISVGKPIIAPTWIDEEKEFSSFTHYFSNEQELVGLLRSLNLKEVSQLSNTLNFNKFSLERVRKAIEV